MKGINQFFVIILLAFTSACSSTQNATNMPPDDVYYSKSDAQQYPQPAVGHPSPSNRNSEGSSNQSQDNAQDYYRGSDSSSQNDYYNSDHYDYDYSARLRRYYAPVYGYGYYDPYYTNLYYYDHNPYSYGSSIYLGYNFWGPSISIGFGFGYGYGYSPYYYSPWYYPYGYYPYYGAYYPYYGGYYPYYGYYGYPCNPYYYNSYDATSSYYYGPRTSISSTGRSGNTTPRTLGEKYQQAVAENRIASLSSTSTSGGRYAGRQNSETTAQIAPARTDNGTGSSRESGGTNSGNPRSNPVMQEQKATLSNPGSDKSTTGRGIISNKNQNGGTRVQTGTQATDSKISTDIVPERNSGGNVRPADNAIGKDSKQAPSRNIFQPKNNAAEGLPGNNGGTAQPSPNAPRSNDWRKNQNLVPNSFDLPKKERNSDRPRQYQQSAPKFEQRQFKQESPQPRQQQQNYSQPQRGNSAPSGSPSNGRGGRK